MGTQADFERRKMETETVLINTERHRVSFLEPAISPSSVHAPPQKLKEAKQELLGSAHGRAAQDRNPGKMTSDAQSQLEAEMLDITQAMKGAANRMGVTIQKNIAVIDRIGDSVDGSVDTIGRAN